MPLTDEQLEALSAAENDRAEFKESLSDRDSVKRTICAFANDLADHRAPGVIIVGLRDDGSCAGVAITEAMEKLVADFRSAGDIEPRLALTSRRVRLRGCDVLTIEVEPTQSPPVRFKGVVWVRRGPTNQKATAEEERRLVERVRWHALSFDQRPVSGARLDDLDMTLFERVYLPAAIAEEIRYANARSREHQLSSLHLAAPDGAPTYIGILVIGKDVRHWLPGAYVQFVRFDGTGLADAILDQKEIDGPLPDFMRRLDEVLELNIRTRTEISGHSIEARLPDYPIEALRQLARNAVMHRTYEGTHAPIQVYWFTDRVEIHNPGGPFGRVSPANFGSPGLVDYRNPQLAHAMKELGYVQRFGIGLSIAARALNRNGNPPFEPLVDSSRVAIIVRSRT